MSNSTNIVPVEDGTTVWLKNGGKLSSAVVTNSAAVICERTNTIYVTHATYDKMKEASKEGVL